MDSTTHVTPERNRVGDRKNGSRSIVAGCGMPDPADGRCGIRSVLQAVSTPGARADQTPSTSRAQDWRKPPGADRSLAVQSGTGSADVYGRRVRGTAPGFTM